MKERGGGGIRMRSNVTNKTSLCISWISGHCDGVVRSAPRIPVLTGKKTTTAQSTSLRRISTREVRASCRTRWYSVQSLKGVRSVRQPLATSDRRTPCGGSSRPGACCKLNDALNMTCAIFACVVSLDVIKRTSVLFTEGRYMQNITNML